ncbi:hypothetical protein LH51_01535 [Nitrincola sp. A-D6]|uniref:FecR domain-containing protein n=1 Tax=Nitrincola sp. A-D6 TaxID=1545442 RepID=UPI00051FF174|nr:FecR domain-containing protein [Nitrincola sp. A-D6]KGK43214.1 hypothetical protein LH51_01535 [Nitrincola sp. A-D6]
MNSPPQTIPESVARDAVELLLDWQMQVEPDSWERIRRWRAAHPDHERAWQQIENTQQQLSVLSPTTAKLARNTLSSGQQSRRRSLKIIALLCMGTGSGWLISRQPGITIGQDQHYTGTGEQLELQLPGGSHIQLNSRTAIRLSYNHDNTQIHLLQGEIFIQTAANPAAPPRPVLITTAQGVLTPVGTAFNVRQLHDSTQVAVIAGQVLLIQGPVQEPHLIPTGETLLFSNTALVSQNQVMPADTAWRQGMLIADSMPLRQFVEQLERYHRGVIRLDPALDTLRVSGSYPIQDTHRVLESLSHSLPITLEQRSRYWISLRPDS